MLARFKSLHVTPSSHELPKQAPNDLEAGAGGGGGRKLKTTHSSIDFPCILPITTIIKA